MATEKKRNVDPAVFRFKCRFSFPFVFEADDSQSGEKAKYRVTALISKRDKKTVMLLKKKFGEAIKTGVRSFKGWGGKKPSGITFPLHDGDKPSAKGNDPLPENKGHYYITFSSYDKPTIIGTDGKPLGEQDFYGGCYGYIGVKFYAYGGGPKSKAVGKGVSGELLACIKTEDGEPFGRVRPKAKDIFGDLVDEDEDDDYEDDGDADYEDDDDGDDDDDYVADDYDDDDDDDDDDYDDDDDDDDDDYDDDDDDDDEEPEPRRRKKAPAKRPAAKRPAKRPAAKKPVRKKPRNPWE